VKIKLLYSTFDEKGIGNDEQHLTCYLIDDCVAIDAGSLALSLNEKQKNSVRDIVITHPHLDHIATLPIFIDDLFETLREPIHIHASREAINVLERDIFNWNVYPKFSELKNEFGKIVEYIPFDVNKEFRVKHLTFQAVEVNHQVPTVGLIISDEKSTIGLSSDTAETIDFWEVINQQKRVDALLLESSFPNELEDLARASYHLTPKILESELRKLSHKDLKILAVHIKPSYFEKVCKELKALKLKNLSVMKAGKIYRF
jgi:ribonuclease BN (tRNA processing enzyme)